MCLCISTCVQEGEGEGEGEGEEREGEKGQEIPYITPYGYMYGPGQPCTCWRIRVQESRLCFEAQQIMPYDNKQR